MAQEYLVYTFNEKYTSDKEKIYINSVDRSSGKPLLRSTDDEEYKRVLQVIEEWFK